MTRAMIERIIGKSIERAVSDEIERQLPEVLERVMREKFAREPQVPLTRIGFAWALVLGFETAWPGIDRPAAASYAKDCLEIPVGTPGYDWSASAANELVREYVSEHGEQP